jgi:hypothetical protein
VRLAICAALAATVLGSFALGLPAAAQYGPADVPHMNSQDTGKPRNSSVSFYPFSEFKGRGFLIDGSLFAAETGFLTGYGKSSYALGGWGFFRGSKYQVELHGKYFFNSQVGVQVGGIKTNNVNGLDIDVFALYNLSSRRLNPSTHYPWNVQFGLGPYIYSKNSAQFTGFIQGSLEVIRNWTVDASYWYIGSPFGANIDRFAAGVSYKF